MAGSILTRVLTAVQGQTPSVQQVSLIRKLIYIGLILALFTTSYFYRTLAAEPQAQALALRDRDVGEVELTGSAMRLSLTGLRGLATCIVWEQAIDKFKKGQWEELDLLVSSATRLQPHFNTPWQFQSWNMAFNVVNRCDRPGDKYFYIARGLQLLAQGERQNRYDPEMRFHIGLYYQMRIGRWEYWPLMTALMELSCIDPIQRDPARFRHTTPEGQVFSYSQLPQHRQDRQSEYDRLDVQYKDRQAHSKTRLANYQEQAQAGQLPANPAEWPEEVKKELAQIKGEIAGLEVKLANLQRELDDIDRRINNFDNFCRSYPRLIRRLREPPTPRIQKAMVSPEEIISFLEQHRDIPSLYGTKRAKHGEEERTERKRNKDHPFPVWPQNTDPDASTRYDPEQLPAPLYLKADFEDLDSENNPHDVFLEARAWFLYAQEPLPDPLRNRPGSSNEEQLKQDPIRRRIPKHMTTIIFRDYPARARSYVAERLAEEGWFEEDGWELEWDPAISSRRLSLGQGIKWGKKSWELAAEEWQKYGDRNGLELSPEELQRANSEAELYRQKYLREPLAMPIQPNDPDPEIQKSFLAADQLHWYRHYRHLINFAHHFHRAEEEQHERTVQARKALYEVKREERRGLPPEALREQFEDALVLWRGVLMANPVFAADQDTQSETNEMAKRYMELFVRSLNGERLKELLLVEAALGQGVAPDVGQQVVQSFRASRPRLVAPPLGVVYVPTIDLRYPAVVAQAAGPPTALLWFAAAQQWLGPRPQRVYTRPGAILSPEGPIDDQGRLVYRIAPPVQ